MSNSLKLCISTKEVRDLKLKHKIIEVGIQSLSNDSGRESKYNAHLLKIRTLRNDKESFFF